jgi:hypothetical protein
MNANAVHTIETAEDANKKAVHDDMISPAFTPPTLQPWTASTSSLCAPSGTG